MEKQETNKTTEEEQQKKRKEEQAAELEDRIIYAEANKDGKDSRSALANGGCGVCERKGFPIFLVRKAPISTSFSLAQQMGEAIKFTDTKREPQVDLLTHKYVYRTLRVGYVYILVKHKTKGWEFLGYEVTPSGVFRHKTITDLKERNVKEIPAACTKDGNNHHIPGSFINIDTSVYEGEAYIAYTRRAWSQGENSAVEKYLKLMNESSITIDLPSKQNQGNDSSQNGQNSNTESAKRNTKTIDLDTALKRFTKINLNQAAYKDPNQLTEGGKRSFEFNKLLSDNSLLELAAKPTTIVHNEGNDDENDNDDKQLIENKNTFITAHKFNSLRDRHKANKKEYLDSCDVLKNQINTFEKDKRFVVPVVVIEDPFGIAEELSLQRQLKIEPITQLIIQSEEIYAKKIDENYKKIIEANKRLDEKYNAILNNKEPVSDKSIFDDINEHQYYDTYHSLSSNIISKEYFKEERLHKRKTLALINEYRNQIISSETAKAKDKVFYDYYTYIDTGQGPLFNNFPKSEGYLKQGFVEIAMSKEEKSKHLEKFKGLMGITYLDVRAFKQNNTAEQAANENIEKQLEKYNSLINTSEEQNFIAKEQADYNKLVESIVKLSQDYFYYLTWLFGFNGCSQYAPSVINQYNDCEFWLIECDTNCSNNHVGYLTDFIKLIDFTCLGNVKMEEQSAVWDTLLNNADSLFYHLIDGQQGSFWELVFNKRLNIMQDELALHSSFAPQLTNKTEDQIKAYLQQQYDNEQAAKQKRVEQTKVLLQELEEDLGQGKLANNFFAEKGELMLNLYFMLFARVSAGLANRPPMQSQTNQKQGTKQADGLQLKVMPLIIQSNLVIHGYLMLYIKLQNIPIAKLSEVLNYWEPFESSDQELSYKNYTLTDDSQDSTIDWDLVSTYADYASFGLQIIEIGANKKILENGIALFYAIKESLTFALNRDWFNAALSFGFAQSRSLNIVNQIKIDFCTSILKNIKETRISTRLPKTADIAIGIGNMAVAGVQSWVAHTQYLENLKKLDDPTLSETVRFEIKRDVQFGLCKVAANHASTVSEVLLFLNKTLPRVWRRTLRFNKSMRLISNSVLKGSVGVTAVLGSITSFITILEGGILFLKGYAKGGEVGTAHMIAGGLQMFSGFVFLIQSVGLLGLFSGPIGAAIFILGLVAGVAAAIIQMIYKDETDDWDKMQIWFNYCLFGLQQPSDKGVPYLANFDSMALAINDFMVARTGLYAVLQLENSTFYASETRDYKQIIERNRNTRVSVYIGSVIKKVSKEVYLSVGLPNFKSELSDYEGKIRFLDVTSQELVTLNISNGKQYPILTFTQDSAEDLLIKRKEHLMPVTFEIDLKTNKVGRVEYYEKAKDEDNNDLGYFKIFYKTGECCFSANKEINLQLYYWPTGRTTKDNQGNTVDANPIIISDTYKR
ncbi:toxin VasX [Gilliamella sp. CG25]|uniref:toxin VasX n=1 Tax=unclassified Gilliamella TaxID=2685620 RepID=UPI003988343F